MLLRAVLSAVQVDVGSCGSGISGASNIRSFDMLYGFTIEQNRIYIMAREVSICNIANFSVSMAINFAGHNNATFTYGASPLFFNQLLVDSFSQFIVIGTSDPRGIGYISTDTVVLSCNLPQGSFLSGFMNRSLSVSMLRMFRESQQLAPSKWEKGDGWIDGGMGNLFVEPMM